MKLNTLVKQFLPIILFLFQIKIFANIQCKILFNSENSKIQGLQILHDKDQKLHLSTLVAKAVNRHKLLTGDKLAKPIEKLEKWAEYLQRINNKAENSQFVSNRIKEILFYQFVIKNVEVPESYYNQQIQLARERGHGHIQLNSFQKNKLAETVIEDQKASLSTWIEYLISSDTKMYPIWIKYWIITGMVKLSKYNPNLGTFGNRDKGTVAPFIELNREALSITIDHVLNYLNKNLKELSSDPEILTKLNGMNFGKLYGHVLSKLGVGKEGIYKTNQGKWIIYPKGSDHMPLVNSLKGKNTGWCTAGEETAKSQLRDGDFHVYYSLDEEGLPTLPRVAIRMEAENIAEIRGVAKDQNLDSQINESTVISSKLKEFGTKGDQFNKRSINMKMLTLIEKKTLSNITLTAEEIKFLYEINEPIIGFGYEKDPRIEEIKKLRIFNLDMEIALDYKYKAEEISNNPQDVLSGKIKIFFGDLDLNFLTEMGDLKLPEIIKGSLFLNGLNKAEGLVIHSEIAGEIQLNGLVSAKGVVFPTIAHSDIFLNGLISAEYLVLPLIIKGTLKLNGLVSAKYLILPETIKGSLFLNGLVSAKYLKLPLYIENSLFLNSLISGKYLVFPASFSEIDPNLIDRNQKLKRFSSNSGIFLNGLKSAEGLILPTKLNKGLILNGLKSAKGLFLPKIIIGDLILEALESIDQLILPEILVLGELSLDSIGVGSGLIIPNEIERVYSPRDLRRFNYRDIRPQ